MKKGLYNGYLKSPLNYIGNKYRIMPQLQEKFPTDINAFVDLFCGGLDVTINTKANIHYANDINYHIIDIFKAFQENTPEYLLAYIDKTVAKWDLSTTNEEGFKAFREYYNNTRNPLDLYVLICYSFNYQFRFNSKHEFNGSFGRNKSWFSDILREELLDMLPEIKDVKFSANEFQNFDFSILSKEDFLYVDPPYLISVGSYNDGKRGFTGWSEHEENLLLGILTDLDKEGIRWGLSNVTEHKGLRNELLIDWVNLHGFNLYDMNVKYNHSNYHAKHTDKVTKEVFITNY